MDRKGKVYLVGAGPGDPGLITLRAVECIAEADVVVYDRLASRRLLGYAREDAEMVYVGKAPDRHTLRQEEINALLVDRASRGLVVTRLKGGDPFLFGRGGEEAEVLREEGIPFEVVPGVTSAIAVPAYAGIPLTHREHASSVALITGHEDPTKAESALNWAHLARGVDTLVFLMGMKNLPMIVERLIRHGRDPGTPVAVIGYGTLPEQRTVRGTLWDIVQAVEEAGLRPPAVIVVGDVVTLRDRLNWREEMPLFGQRVLVTRSRAQASALSARIEALGGEAWEFPVIAIAEPEDYAALDGAIEEIGKYQWLVFTSANGVEAFFARLRSRGVDIRALQGIKVAAIGVATARAVEERGLLVELVPEEFRAETLARELLARAGVGERVLLARADIARPVLAEMLAAGGLEVDDVTVYRTVLDGSGREEVLKLLREGRIQFITFTSSSTVKNFVKALGGVEGLTAGEVADLVAASGAQVACIGPITAATAREMGLSVNIVAEEYTIEGLIGAIMGRLRGTPEEEISQ